MFCVSCGTVLPNDAVFCPRCGAKITWKQSEEKCCPDNSRMYLLECSSCGSHDLKRVRKGEYICEHCGSRFFMDDEDDIETNEEADAKLLALFDEAAKYEQKGDTGKELQILVKGLDIAPADCTLMLKLGRAYWKLGYLKKALEYYQKAEESDPDDPIVYINIGALYLKQKQYTKAKPFFEKGIAMIEADPLSASVNDTAVSYGNYAWCIGELGDMENAVKYLSMAKEKGYSLDSIKTICRSLRLNPGNI